MADIKVYDIGYKEIHMVGRYVGVCWNTCWDIDDVKKVFASVEDRKQHTTLIKIRCSPPYIDFPALHQEGNEYREDRDSAVSGGLSLLQAKQLAEELSVAISYLADQVKDAQSC